MGVAGDSSTYSSSSAGEPIEAEPPERLVIAVVEEEGDWSGFGAPREAIQEVVRALARHGRPHVPEGSEASVVLGSDALVRGLNRTYRGKDASTNVLAFPFKPPRGAPGGGAPYLGDVVLAAETVRGEASERGIEPRHHLQHLVLHGLLHLLGCDHGTDSTASVMEGLETEILAVIGVPDPYASPPDLEDD
jgi:probable rRNA maturation factor